MTNARRKYRKDPFIIIFIVWYTTEIIFNTTLKSVFGIKIDLLNSITNYLVLMLLVLHIIFFQKYKMKEIIIIAVISIPMIISAVLSSAFSLLSAWLFVVAAKNTEFEKIIKTAYKVLCIMIPIVIVMRFLNVIEDYTTSRGGIIRYSLGFSHPNQLGLRIFQLIVCHLFVNRNKLRKYDYCLIIALSIFSYLVPNSQTSYISMMILTILLLIYTIIEERSKILTAVFGKALLILSALFNILSICWSIINVKEFRILNQINTLLSTRFSNCHKVFQIYGIPLFGQQVYIFEDERKTIGILNKLYLDNGYMVLLLRYGLIAYIIFSVGYLYVMSYLKDRKQYFIVIVLFVYALYGVMENGIFMISHNIFLIIFADVLYGNEKRYKDDVIT